MGLAQTKKLYQYVLNHNAVEIKEKELDTSRKSINHKPSVKSVRRRKFKPIIKNYFKLSLQLKEYLENSPISRFGLCTCLNEMGIAKQFMNLPTAKEPVSYLGNYKHAVGHKLAKTTNAVNIFEDLPKKNKNSPKNIIDAEIQKFSLIKLPFKKIQQEEDYSKDKSPSVRDALKKSNLRLKRNPQKAIKCANRNFRRAIMNISALSKMRPEKSATFPKIKQPTHGEFSDSINLGKPLQPLQNINMNGQQGDIISGNSEEIKSVIDESKNIKNDEIVTVEGGGIQQENVDETENLAKNVSNLEQIPEECSQMSNNIEFKITGKLITELNLTYTNSNKSMASSCTTPSDTAKACVKYRKTAQQALSQLNDQVSSVLRNSLCSIDDIRQRVHTTVTEINKNELHYEYLKTHPNACTVRNSEPFQNVNELDVSPSVAQTQSETAMVAHPPEIVLKTSYEELVYGESKASVELPANKCKGMSTLPKIVSLGELLNLTPSKAEQELDTVPENDTKIERYFKNSEQVAEEKVKPNDVATKTCLLRIEAHRDLHTILVQEMETENEKCWEPRRNKSKSLKLGKKRTDGSVHIAAEELYVPEKQINKILTNSEVLAENTFSLTSPQCCHVPKENKKNSKLASLCTKSKSLMMNSSSDNYDKTLKKYSDSLWFSSRSNKRKLKMTKEVVLSKDGSETVIKLAASKSSVVIEHSIVQTDDTIKLPRRCNILSVNYKNRLNCFDILDEITLADLKPIEPEYPRKDHIGTNQSSIKVEKTYLYNLVYACSNQYFMQMINVQIPQPNCTFPNCLLCKSAYQSLRNGNKCCQTDMVEKSTTISRRETPNSSKSMKVTPGQNKSRSRTPTAPKKRRRLKSESRKSENSRGSHTDLKTSKKLKEKNKPNTNYPNEKRQRRNAGVEQITEKLRPFMLDPCIRYHKNVTVAQTTLINTKECRTKKTAANEVIAKLRPYIFDFKDRHFNTYTVMPVFVNTYNKAEPVKNCLKCEQASPEVREKLRPYISDPNQNHFSAIRVMPIMVNTSHKLKSKTNKNLNNQGPSKYLVRSSSSSFEKPCKRCYSQLLETPSRLSCATSSSSDVGKLQPFLWDNSRKHPNIVTAMPAAVKTVDNLKLNASGTFTKFQKGNSGDYPMYGSSKAHSKAWAKQHFPKAQFKSSASLDKNEPLSKSRTNAASNLISFLAKQNLIQPQNTFGDNLNDYLRQKPTQIVGVALTQKTPKKSVSSKLDHVVHTPSPHLMAKSLTLSKTSNEIARPATPKTQAKVRRKALTPRNSQLPKPPKEVVEKSGSTKNVLENNIQNVIEMIETKIIDIISSPDKTHSETFNNVEQEIIQILDTIRKVETKPLNTIQEGADGKGSQAEMNVLHKQEENCPPLTPNDSSTLQTKSELSKKGPKFFHFDSEKKIERPRTTSSSSQQQSHFFTDVNSSVEKLERTVNYLEADQQQYHAPTKSETLKDLATKSNRRPSKQKISKSEKFKKISQEEISKIDKEEVQKIIEKRVESINEIINKLNTVELVHDEDVENKLRTIKKLSESSLTDNLSRGEETRDNLILDPLEESFHTTNEKVVEKLYVNDGKIQDMCDKEVSTTTLDHEVAKNEDDENNKLDKCKSSNYLTPFMKALIKYRNEDSSKSSSILDFLDTLNTLSNDSPILKRLSKMNFSQKITISEILQITKIYYPAEIYHPISMYSNAVKKTDERWLLSLFKNLRKRLRCKPIESKKNEETPKLCSIQSSGGSACLVKSSKNIDMNLIEIPDVMYDDKQHGSFLNSLYSALFAAVFFSFTLNYSCH